MLHDAAGVKYQDDAGRRQLDRRALSSRREQRFPRCQAAVQLPSQEGCGILQPLATPLALQRAVLREQPSTEPSQGDHASEQTGCLLFELR